MTETKIQTIIDQQRSYFYTGATLSPSFRIQALRQLKSCILKFREEIHEALRKDLGKSGFESYMCETSLTLSEISHMIKHIPSYSREKHVPVSLPLFPSHCFQKPSPYGVSLIMSPWNYPFLLSFEPLADAIAAGNTVVLKPSAYSPHTSQIIKKIVESCFEPRYVSVITGGREENACLLRQHFDYLFFTGSQSVGREVMRQAAAHLTPVTLELGGKSPCIVEKTANLKLAAKRIVFGKFLNCGQTCVAPDYIYCAPEIKEALIKALKLEIQKQYGRSPLDNRDYGKIINQKHFHRITRLIAPKKVVAGGTWDPDSLRIAPTIMDHVTFDDPIMQEEIFGPVLPILTYPSLSHAIKQINSMPHPLALYLFTNDTNVKKMVSSRCSFGGGCINDTIVHLATSAMGFGGFGESGMGAYHGKAGFDTFTHYKSMVDKKRWPDLPMRYQPYQDIYNKLIHWILP